MNLCPIRARRKIVNVWDAAHLPAREKLPAVEPRARAHAPAKAAASTPKAEIFRSIADCHSYAVEGFTPPNQVTYNEINLDQLSEAFKSDADVTLESLEAAHLLRDPRDPVVVLGHGDLKVALKVKVQRVSASAKSKIEKAGGSVELIQ